MASATPPSNTTPELPHPVDRAPGRPGSATLADARQIALSLPDTTEKISWGSMHWRVHGVGFAWERPLNKTDRAALKDAAPGGEILAARVADLAERDTLIATEPEVFFTIPHFGDWPAVLIRLERIGADELAEVITDAWLDRAPQRARKAFLAAHPSRPALPRSDG